MSGVWTCPLDGGHFAKTAYLGMVTGRVTCKLLRQYSALSIYRVANACPNQAEMLYMQPEQGKFSQ